MNSRHESVAYLPISAWFLLSVAPVLHAPQYIREELD